jgi:Protein of unknown function (DUF3307)
MLETMVALALGHVLADFVLQTDGMVREKAQPKVLLLHVVIVAATSWLALGLAIRPLLLLLIAASHYSIDWLKQRYGGPSFAPFIFDQGAHVAMIALGAALWPGAHAAGLWGLAAPASLAPWLGRLPAAMALATGLVAAVWAGDYAVRAIMVGLTPPDPASLPKGGRLIGRLERAMILMLVVAGQTDAIGFLIAAKSLLRFSELARDANRLTSEYVIIGTLASFAWGLATAFVTRAALTALAP